MYIIYSILRIYTTISLSVYFLLIKAAVGRIQFLRGWGMVDKNIIVNQIHKYCKKSG